jgi:hypothetical protein
MSLADLPPGESATRNLGAVDVVALKILEGISRISHPPISIAGM